MQHRGHIDTFGTFLTILILFSKGNSGTLVGWLKNQPGYQAFINSLPKKFGRLPGGSGQKNYNLMLGP
jgi:hypothetical protein